jgi:hypothetical protein
MVMSLAGRSKEGGGHRPVKISVDKDIHELLKRIQKQKPVSQLIEEMLRPLQDLKLVDPEILTGVHSKLISSILRAVQKGDLEEARELTDIALKLKPWVDLAKSGISNITITGSPMIGTAPLTTRFFGIATDGHGNPVPEAELYMFARDKQEQASDAVGTLIAKFTTNESGDYGVNYVFKEQGNWHLYIADNPFGS